MNVAHGNGSDEIPVNRRGRHGEALPPPIMVAASPGPRELSVAANGLASSDFQPRKASASASSIRSLTWRAADGGSRSQDMSAANAANASVGLTAGILLADLLGARARLGPTPPLRLGDSGTGSRQRCEPGVMVIAVRRAESGERAVPDLLGLGHLFDRARFPY